MAYLLATLQSPFLGVENDAFWYCPCSGLWCTAFHKICIPSFKSNVCNVSHLSSDEILREYDHSECHTKQMKRQEQKSSDLKRDLRPYFSNLDVRIWVASRTPWCLPNFLYQLKCNIVSLYMTKMYDSWKKRWKAWWKSVPLCCLARCPIRLLLMSSCRQDTSTGRQWEVQVWVVLWIVRGSTWFAFPTRSNSIFRPSVALSNWITPCISWFNIRHTRFDLKCEEQDGELGNK